MSVAKLQQQISDQQQTINRLSKENADLRGKLKKYSGGAGGSAGGVSTGPSRQGAAAALMASLGKGKGPAGGSSGGRGAGATNSGGGNPRDEIFRKYEKMMKLGISIHGALGRMIQNGEKSEIIDEFKKKHSDKLVGDGDEKVDLGEIGLREKRKIRLSKNIKMKRLHWDPINPRKVPNSIWEDLDESTIRYDSKKFELNFQVRERKDIVKDSSKLRSNKNDLNSSEKKTFVSKKRSQQVLIGIRGLGLTNKQLRGVLHNMDEKVW